MNLLREPSVHEDGAHLSSLDERAYLTLREMIVKGTLQPGEQLVQEALAEKLGLSRTPLRKAVATLAQEGFVEITSRGAAFVRSFTDQELTSIWEIRAVLEGLACRTAVRTAKPQHVAYLRSLITSAMEEVTPDDWTAYREADRQFHSYIAEVAGDPLLIRILDAYQILSISLAQGLLRPPAETLPEHLEILDAIAAGDADRAERTMVRHIRSSMRYLKLRSGNGGGRAVADLLRPVVKAPLAALVAATDETAFVACRDRQEAVVIARREPNRMLRISCGAEARLPLHATAAGKVLLASSSGRKAAKAILDGKLVQFTSSTVVGSDELRSLLEKTEREGYASEEEEFENGVCGLAAPIEDGGETIAAVSLLVPAARFSSRRDALLRELRAAAAAIRKSLNARTSAA